MKILIAGGTGFIGKFLVKYFQKHNHEIAVLSRSTEKINSIFQDQVDALDWEAIDVKGPSAIQSFDVIINLCGAGIANQRWTKSRKQILMDSRLEPTKKLINHCVKLNDSSPTIFNASAIGIYETQDPIVGSLPKAFDEDTTLDFEHPTTFSTELTRRWENATWPAKQAGIRVVNMRFGVVLGPSGGSLSRLKLPFFLFIGGKIGSGTQPFSWVSIVDLARAIDFLIPHKSISGPVNIVSPNCVQQAELADAIGKVLNKPSIVSTPAFMLKSLFGEMADELLLRGQHVYPKRLLENGFEFRYPDIETALEYALLHHH